MQQHSERLTVQTQEQMLKEIFGTAYSDAGFYSGLTAGLLTLLNLGHESAGAFGEAVSPKLGGVLGEALSEKLGNICTGLGYTAAMGKYANLLIFGGADRSSVFDLIKDVSLNTFEYINWRDIRSTAFSTAMASFWVVDYVLTKTGEEAMAIRMEDMGEIYQHFNDYYNEGQYRARTLKQWRQIIIDIVEAHPNDDYGARMAMEDEVDRYARIFWELPTEEVWAVTASAGFKRMPYPNASETEALVAEYKKSLYDRLHPVFTSVRNYMQKKIEAEYLAALNDLKKFMNQRIDITVKEELADDEEPKYGGYTVRLAPLGPDAVVSDWTRKLGNGGMTNIPMYLTGYAMAGCPNEVRIWKPGDDPDKDDPELVVPFTLEMPETIVPIGGDKNEGIDSVEWFNGGWNREDHDNPEYDLYLEFVDDTTCRYRFNYFGSSSTEYRTTTYVFDPAKSLVTMQTWDTGETKIYGFRKEDGDYGVDYIRVAGIADHLRAN